MNEEKTKLTQKEINILQDSSFIRRIKNYDFNNIDDLIVNAWDDTDPASFPEENFSDEFILIVESIEEVFENE